MNNFQRNLKIKTVDRIIKKLKKYLKNHIIYSDIKVIQHDLPSDILLISLIVRSRIIIGIIADLEGNYKNIIKTDFKIFIHEDYYHENEIKMLNIPNIYTSEKEYVLKDIEDRIITKFLTYKGIIPYRLTEIILKKSKTDIKYSTGILTTNFIYLNLRYNDWLDLKVLYVINKPQQELLTDKYKESEVDFSEVLIFGENSLQYLMKGYKELIPLISKYGSTTIPNYDSSVLNQILDWLIENTKKPYLSERFK